MSQSLPRRFPVSIKQRKSVGPSPPEKGNRLTNLLRFFLFAASQRLKQHPAASLRGLCANAYRTVNLHGGGLSRWIHWEIYVIEIRNQFQD